MIGVAISGSLWPLLPAQGTACISAGLAASYLLRRRPARAHQTLLTALLASILTPGAYVLVKHFELGALAARPVLQTQERGMGDLLPMRIAEQVEGQNQHGQEPCPSCTSLTTEVAGAPAPLSIVAPAVTAPAHDVATTDVPWGIVVAVCWMAASTLLLLRLALRFFLGLRLLRTAHPLESGRLHRAVEVAKDRLGIAGPVRVCASERIKSPVIWCWARKPVLLVHEKAGVQEGSVDWVGIFCHEFAHLKRRDHLSGLFADVLTALFPWHPLLWWARGRLVRLSEQACDDWVLAAGEMGVDYAESLLDLVPQRATAILPTVVGKEKAMKERIRRIVKNGCGNPTVGLRWAVVVSVLAVLAVVGVAVAQRRPVERGMGEPQWRPEVREEFAGQRPAVIGRRNVLMRLREQLQNQARETENVLRERGTEMGEESRVLRAELETLHQQVEMVEQQLRDLEGGPRRPDRMEIVQQARGQTEQREREALTERLRQLQARSREIQRNLQERPDMEPDRADALQLELSQTRAMIGEMERELRDSVRRQKEPEGEQPQRGRPEPPGRREWVLDNGKWIFISPDQSRERDEAVRRGPGPEGFEAQLGDLRRHRDELAKEMERVERELQGLGEGQDAEARELRAHLQELHSAMGNAERHMAELRRVAADIERIRVVEESERVQAEGRRAREASERIGDLARRRRNLDVRLREIQRELEERPDQENEETRALRQERDKIQDELAATERELENAQRAQAMFDRERPAPKLERRGESREPDVPGIGPRRTEPEREPALERQMDELRNQMQEFREQMQQMQRALEQLAQQKAAEQPQRR